MKWGYHWELGPFEMWDALGIHATVERLEKEGREVPALIRDLLKAAKNSFYQEQDGHRSFFNFGDGEYQSETESKKVVSLARLHKAKKTVLTNPGASLVDLGDGVACL